MPTLPQFILTLICLLIPHTTTARNQICGRTSCGNGPSIQFPFRLREANQSDRCGYPGFELSCNNRNQTLLTLPYAGDFEVKAISRTDQKVWINDPNNCLPQRFLHNMDLTAGSSFRFSETYSVVNLTFLNCSSNVTELTPLEPIYCLTSINNDNYSVMAIESDPPYSTEWISSCQVISTALVPFSDMTRWLFFTGLLADVELQWSQPDCRDCEKHGGRCGLSGDTGLEVACNLQDQGEGVSRNAKYGIALGLGISGGLFIIGMVWLFSRKLINSEGRQHQESIESRIVQLPVVSVGLGRETIEKYPKTELGESGRLPNPDDNVCSICLCEYQPKETLRTIPECNHYFHLNCIDGWLKMNATCPLCRNLPETESLSLGTLSRSSTSSGS